MRIEEREILLGDGLFKVPERLLLAHARGETLFITGAGTSMPALPDFRRLVLEVYRRLDLPTFEVLSQAPAESAPNWLPPPNQLTNEQLAEVRRFVQKDYDVALGMLERRIDLPGQARTQMRGAVTEVLSKKPEKALEIHSTLIRLSLWEERPRIVTTNFDRLLEEAARRLGKRISSYALGAIPRPSKGDEFSGIFHIHGVLSTAPDLHADLIVTDRDFGEFYLRRRTVSDFIYDAARLFNLVLVGYSASDPPMRYLLNAVAADGSRFTDLKDRFAFIGAKWPFDPVEKADWIARGIIPIPYDSADNHSLLPRLLKRWSDLSVNAKPEHVERTLKKIVKRPSRVLMKRSEASAWFGFVVR